MLGSFVGTFHFFFLPMSGHRLSRHHLNTWKYVLLHFFFLWKFCRNLLRSSSEMLTCVVFASPSQISQVQVKSKTFSYKLKTPVLQITFKFLFSSHKCHYVTLKFNTVELSDCVSASPTMKQQQKNYVFTSENYAFEVNNTNKLINMVDM